MDQRNLLDGYAEAMASDRRVSRRRLLDSPAREFCLSFPGTRFAFRWILCGTVDRQPGKAQKVRRLPRMRHHPEVDVAVPELDLDPTDARRAVLPKRGNRFVLPDVEALANAAGQVRLRLFKLPPASHDQKYPWSMVAAKVTARTERRAKLAFALGLASLLVGVTVAHFLRAALL